MPRACCQHETENDQGGADHGRPGARPGRGGTARAQAQRAGQCRATEDHDEQGDDEVRHRSGGRRAVVRLGGLIPDRQILGVRAHDLPVKSILYLSTSPWYVVRESFHCFTRVAPSTSFGVSMRWVLKSWYFWSANDFWKAPRRRSMTS